MTFDQCIEKLLGHEGDFSNHKDDPGGATRFGITEAVARKVGYRGDMRELPMDLAKKIYRNDYWDAVQADELPEAIRYPMFDAAVNSGTRQSAIWLQRALGVTADGVIGPVTLASAAKMDGRALCAKILAQRLRFMSGLFNWPAFGRGWARRIADLMETT
jgi:lysozyme family protein